MENSNRALGCSPAIAWPHPLRERFDSLVCKIGELEKENISLIGTINNATASNSNVDGSRGGKRRDDHSKDPAVTTAVKERLKVIGYRGVEK